MKELFTQGMRGEQTHFVDVKCAKWGIPIKTKTTEEGKIHKESSGYPLGRKKKPSYLQASLSAYIIDLLS